MNDDLPVLDTLKTEIERMTRVNVRRWRWPATLTAIVVAGCLGTGVALAAQALLEEGEPVSNPPGVTAVATEGLGVTPPEDAKLLAPRVPDPDGGPPWGLQLAGTTRSLGCLQVGRVANERLGVLGADGAFENDGKFHPLPAQVQREQHCQPKDANGRTYIAVSANSMPASAYGGGCSVQAIPKSVREQLEKYRGKGNVPPRCDRDRVRRVLFGLLGPQARSVEYRDERGRRRTAPTSGPEGAYLVVTRQRGLGNGGWVTAPSPGSGLTAIRYADGTVCKIRSARRLGGAKMCPRVGFAPREVPQYEPGKLRAKVTLDVADKPERPPLPPDAPKNVPNPLQRKVTVRFRAPVAGDAVTYYGVFLEMPRHGKRCTAGALGGSVARDVAAGEDVRWDAWMPSGCRGEVKVRVFLHSNANGDDQMPFAGGNPIRDPLVGEARTGVR